MISNLKKERDRLVRLLSDTQLKLNGVNFMLRGAELYDRQDEPPDPDDTDPTNFMGTLFQIINASPKPLSKKDLKAEAEAKGLDKEKLDGTYFYVALNRMKKARRISVHKDGNVWKMNSKD